MNNDNDDNENNVINDEYNEITNDNQNEITISNENKNNDIKNKDKFIKANIEEQIRLKKISHTKHYSKQSYIRLPMPDNKENKLNKENKTNKHAKNFSKISNKVNTKRSNSDKNFPFKYTPLDTTDEVLIENEEDRNENNVYDTDRKIIIPRLPLNMNSVKRNIVFNYDDPLNTFDTDRKLLIDSDRKQNREEINHVVFLKELCAIGNEFQTESLFHKYKMNDLFVCMLSIQVLILSIISYQVKNENQDLKIDLTFRKQVTNAMLGLNSVIYIMQVCQVTFNYIISLKIKIYTKKCLPKETILSTGLWKYFIFDLVFYILHPNYFCRDIIFNCYIESFKISYKLEVNDVLLVITSFRAFDLLKTLIRSNVYSSVRAYRISHMFGLDFSTGFILKSVVYYLQESLLMFFWVVSTCLFAFILKVLMGPVTRLKVYSSYLSAKIDFENFETCIWNLLVSSFTVGYGDTYPISEPGRVTNVISAFLGLIIIACLIITVHMNLALNENEKNVITFLDRMESTQELNEKLGQLVLNTLKFLRKKNKFKKAILKRENKDHISKLKEELEIAYIERYRMKKDYMRCYHVYNLTWKTFDLVDEINVKVKRVSKEIENVNQTNLYIIKTLREIKEKRVKESLQNEIIDLVNE